MIGVDRIDIASRRQVRRFVDLPYRLYRGHPCWVPPPRADVLEAMDPRRHPFYEHSQAEFFVAVDGGTDVGRIAALEHRPFNVAHGARDASFYFFECADNPAIAEALVGRVLEWARARGLTRLAGQKGFSAFDGYGVLVDGFEHRQTMTMANYNRPYYGAYLERIGFRKDVDFVSFRLDRDTFVMPDRVRAIAERARSRGHLQVVRFPSKRALVASARAIGAAYNGAFEKNWEYYPLSVREIDYLLGKVMVLANRRLMKIIRHGDRFVGFLLAFPDVSAALQRARGRLTPWAILDLLLETRRTAWVALNGAGILPEFRHVGGHALLYAEIEDTVGRSRFRHADLPQVADTAVEMRRSLAELKAVPWKTHRVYVRDV